MTIVEAANIRPEELEHRRLGFHFQVSGSMKNSAGEVHAGAYAALADVLISISFRVTHLRGNLSAPVPSAIGLRSITCRS